MASPGAHRKEHKLGKWAEAAGPHSSLFLSFLPFAAVLYSHLDTPETHRKPVPQCSLQGPHGWTCPSLPHSTQHINSLVVTSQKDFLPSYINSSFGLCDTSSSPYLIGHMVTVLFINSCVFYLNGLWFLEPPFYRKVSILMVSSVMWIVVMSSSLFWNQFLSWLWTQASFYLWEVLGMSLICQDQYWTFFSLHIPHCIGGFLYAWLCTNYMIGYPGQNHLGHCHGRPTIKIFLPFIFLSYI